MDVDSSKIRPLIDVYQPNCLELLHCAIHDEFLAIELTEAMGSIKSFQAE